MTKLNHEVKELCIEVLKDKGTMQAASKVCGVSVRTLNEEMRRSEIFKRRVLEAREEGKSNRGDKAIQFISDVAEGIVEVKMPQLTANLALANWAVPGFRGVTTITGRVDHDFRVITAVPRPKYDELPEGKSPKVIAIDKVKELNKGEDTESS